MFSCFCLFCVYENRMTMEAYETKIGPKLFLSAGFDPCSSVTSPAPTPDNIFRSVLRGSEDDGLRQLHPLDGSIQAQVDFRENLLPALRHFVCGVDNVFSASAY